MSACRAFPVAGNKRAIYLSFNWLGKCSKHRVPFKARSPTRPFRNVTGWPDHSTVAHHTENGGLDKQDGRNARGECVPRGAEAVVAQVGRPRLWAGDLRHFADVSVR